MAGKRKVKPLVKLVEKHWSHWLDDLACDPTAIPQEVRDAPTPEIAWKTVDGAYTGWVLGHFGFSSAKLTDVYGDYDTDKIRAKYPNPPRKVLASLNKWLKQKETYED